MSVGENVHISSYPPGPDLWEPLEMELQVVVNCEVGVGD